MAVMTKNLLRINSYYAGVDSCGKVSRGGVEGILGMFLLCELILKEYCIKCGLKISCHPLL